MMRMELGVGVEDGRFVALRIAVSLVGLENDGWFKFAAKSWRVGSLLGR